MLEDISLAFPEAFRSKLVITFRAGVVTIIHPDAPFDLHRLMSIGEVLVGEHVIEVHH